MFVHIGMYIGYCICVRILYVSLWITDTVDIHSVAGADCSANCIAFYY